MQFDDDNDNNDDNDDNVPTTTCRIAPLETP